MLPYWRISAFYACYFGALGVIVPYWGLYLRSLGFDAVAIGELMAIVMGTKIIAPNIWAWIADHTDRRMAIVRFGSLAALLSFIAIFWVRDYWPIALVMLLFSFFWNATLPQFEVTTLSYLEGDEHRYAQLRVWGSIGFIVTVALLGPLIGWHPLGAALVPLLLLILFIGIWLASLTVAERPTPHDAPIATHSLWQVLRQPPVVALMIASFLIQGSHGPYYTFYTLYLQDHGYSETLIGQLWALGVVSEVVIFLLMSRLLLRFRRGQLLLAAMLLTALRWLLIGYGAESLLLLLLAQLLHAASFGLFHAVAIALYHRFFNGRLRGRGQALYSSLSFGAGGAVGAWGSGVGWESIGATGVYSVAAAAALLGGVMTWYGLRHA